MLEEQFKQNTNIINPTSKRIFASRPVDFSTKENDIKAHNLFIQLSNKKRASAKLSRLNDEFLFIKERFSAIDKNIKKVNDQLGKLVNFQNEIVQSVKEKNDSTDFLLFTTKNQTDKIDCQNILLEDDIKQLQEKNDKNKTAINIDSKVISLLKQENANVKCNLTRIKAEHSKISSNLTDIKEKFDCKKSKLNLLLKEKDRLESSQNRMSNSLHIYEEDVLKNSQEILQLESEYFIKKRVSIKLLKYDDTLQPNSDFSNTSKNDLDKKVSEIKSAIYSTEQRNSQIESDISKMQKEYIQSMTFNIDLERKKEELITMNQYLSEIANNLEKEDIQKEKEIKNVTDLINQSKKEDQHLYDTIEEFKDNRFNQDILTNEKSMQWDQYISYISKETSKIKDEINLIKSKKK